MNEAKEFPNFWQALLIMACWATTNLIVWTLTTVWIYNHNNSALYQSIQVILMGLNFIPYIVYLIKKTNIRIWNYFDFPDLTTLLKLIIITVLLRFVIMIPLEKVDTFYKSLRESNIKLIDTSVHTQTLYIVAMSKWILFPILEEILHRGLILKQFLKRFSPTKAIILSSLIFSLVHLRYEDFIGLFVAGAVLGLLYYKTNSILVSSIPHCIYNMAAVFLGSSSQVINSSNMISFLLVYVISIFLLVFVLRKPMNTAKINILTN